MCREYGMNGRNEPYLNGKGHLTDIHIDGRTVSDHLQHLCDNTQLCKD
jgi:hypothetical protein